jgi:hypothetical protein
VDALGSTAGAVKAKGFPMRPNPVSLEVVWTDLVSGNTDAPQRIGGASAKKEIIIGR